MLLLNHPSVSSSSCCIILRRGTRMERSLKIVSYETQLKDDLIGAFKCWGNCYIEEAGNISAITTETRNHRLTLWLKRFKYQETCLNLVDWDSTMDCHGKLRDLLPYKCIRQAFNLTIHLFRIRDFAFSEMFCLKNILVTACHPCLMPGFPSCVGSLDVRHHHDCC